MKKLVIILILVLIPLFLFAVEMESGTITFKGFIGPGFHFTVTPLSSESYDLLNEPSLMPDGQGLDVAVWALSIENPPHNGPLYYIQYDYDPLSSRTTSDEIDFVIIERRDSGESFTKESGESTLIDILDSGTLLYNATIAVRYTEAGVESAQSAGAATDYETNIKVTLLSD